MNYSVLCYFETYPALEQAFETPDGILHPTKEVAEAWVKPYANKNITTYDRPVKEEEEAEDDASNDSGDQKKNLENRLADLKAKYAELEPKLADVEDMKSMLAAANLNKQIIKLETRLNNLNK